MAITYTPTTNFGAKDSLPTNDPDKVIKGSEFTTEFTALQTAFSLAAPNASPTFTGTVTIPTADINGGNIDGTVIGAATPAAGSFTTGSFSGNVSFADNAKAVFGAGSDLQIYHDGFNSYVEDTGDGALFLKTNGAGVFLYSGSEALATFNLNGASNLYYDNGLKLSTTSTGIDVTGTVTADGLTVDGVSNLNGVAQVGGSTDLLYLSGKTGTHAYVSLGSSNTAADFFIGADTAIPLIFRTSATERMRIDSSGNVGIGTASPVTALDVRGEISVDYNATYGLRFYNQGRNNWSSIGNDNTSTGADLVFKDSTGEAMRITGGNVGIGTSSPLAKLDVKNATNERIVVSGSASYGNNAIVAVDDGGGEVGLGLGGNTVEFYTSATERARIDSSGRLLVGATSATGGGFDPTLLLKQRSDGGVSNGLNIEASGSDSVLGIAYNGSEWLIAPSFRSAAGYKPLTFHTNGSERVRIDTSGNLLVGTTAGVGTGSEGIELRGDFGYINTGRNTTDAAGHHQFFNPNGIVGSITTSGSATSYNTSSDQRLKDNIVDAPSASDDIDAIQVRSFDWKADGSHQKYGMVAQELMTVAPEAVSGDPESDDMMGVDYSKLVPMLVKEIQSLRARVAQLEGA